MNTKFKIKRAGAALVSAFMLAGVMAPTYTAVFAEEVSETAETAVVREVNYALGAKFLQMTKKQMIMVLKRR